MNSIARSASEYRGGRDHDVKIVTGAGRRGRGCAGGTSAARSFELVHPVTGAAAAKVSLKIALSTGASAR